MAQPRQNSTWPLSGERQVRCRLQYATPQTDTMGGRSEPLWTDFGTWWAKVSVVPIIPNEIEAVLLYAVEGPYRSDLIDRFNTGVGIRIATPHSLTLKVFQVENPQLRNRTLVAHCANATNTQ
jgi:hypothetical protein